MAYNPNDCVELRWGAPDIEEASTCKRHAAAAQRAKMIECPLSEFLGHMAA
jgi:hypothetical protein